MIFKTSTTTIITFAAILTLSLPGHAEGVKDSSGSWESSTTGALAPMPEGREGYCMGTIDNRIYVSHGLSSVGGDTNDLRVYDIDSNTWLNMASAPTPRSEGVGVEHGGKLYCMGGRYAGVLNTVESYDPDSDSWTTLSPMQHSRAGLAASVVGNRIYTFGGNNVGSGPCVGNTQNVAEVYDIATDTWSDITPPPVPVTHAVSVDKGGLIYLIGGCSDSFTAVGNVQIYDPVADSWSQGTHMPTPRGSMAVGVLGNTIYAIAGYSPTSGTNLDTVEAYDSNTDSWSTKTPKPIAVSEAFAASHNGKLYVPGSGAFGAAQAVNEAFSKK